MLNAETPIANSWLECAKQIYEHRNGKNVYCIRSYLFDDVLFYWRDTDFIPTQDDWEHMTYFCLFLHAERGELL